LIQDTTRSVRSSLDTAQATTATTTTDRAKHTVLAVTWITSGPRRYAPGPASDLSSDFDPSCWGTGGTFSPPGLSLVTLQAFRLGVKPGAR
jgi:hypothetical protein